MCVWRRNKQNVVQHIACGAGTQRDSGRRIAHNFTIQRRANDPFGWWHVAPGRPDFIADWIVGRTMVTPAR